ncbi:MAG: lipopolysaccharide biosynthesis protein [Ruminococcus sp.]|nr:lipopolysaccharide biosynthesis protein [Ruminococcus sp.]
MGFVRIKPYFTAVQEKYKITGKDFAMNLKKAALINAAGKYSQVIIQLGVSAILSRILTPDDYGIVAVVTVFSTFFATLSNMGFGTAIIQKKDLTDEDVNNIYSFTVYVSIVLTAMFSVLSFGIAWFYKDSIYIPIMLLLGISLFFNSMNMVPNGILNRDKKFKTIAIRTVAVYAGAAVVAVILALLHFRYYALIIQNILAAFLNFIWNYVSTKPKFRSKVDMASIKKVSNYSGYQFAFNFINYFAGNLDNLLTGKFFGSTDLGYYNKAYTLSLYPVNNLKSVVSPVLHPILSDYQNEKDVLYSKYIKVLKLMLLLGTYAEAVCYIAGGELITIIFGSQWERSIFCFKMLSLCIVFRMMNSSSGAILQSLGNTKLLFINGLVNTCISTAAILTGIFVFGDINHLSLCVAVAYVLHYVSTSLMVISLGFDYTQKRYFMDMYRDYIVLAVTMAAAFLDFFSIENIFVSAVCKGLYITVVFGAVMFVTKEYKIFTMLLPKKKKTA